MILNALSNTIGLPANNILNELNNTLKGDKAADKKAEKAEKEAAKAAEEAAKAAEKAEKKAAKNGGGAPLPIDNAVRFDLSAPPPPAAVSVPVVAPVVNAAPPPLVQPVAPAAVPVAVVAPVLNAAPAPLVQPAARAASPVLAGSVPASGRGASAPADTAPRAPAPAGTAGPTYKAASLDDEAMARASALRSIARENTLGMIDRIAVSSDKPEAAAAAKRDGGLTSIESAEPKTLARL